MLTVSVYSRRHISQFLSNFCNRNYHLQLWTGSFIFFLVKKCFMIWFTKFADVGKVWELCRPRSDRTLRSGPMWIRTVAKPFYPILKCMVTHLFDKDEQLL